MTRPRPDPLPGFRAVYPGTCPTCDQPIRPGDPIARNRHGHYIHRECAPGWADED